MLRFPPHRRRRMLELILIEITAVPAERSRGRHNPRVVKRKMSGFPTKARASPPPRQVFRYAEHVRIVAPAAGSERRSTPPIPTPAVPPTKRARRTPTQAHRRPAWLEHVRSWRASGLSCIAYCDRHDLDLRTFHHWLARAQASRRPSHRRCH
jgi:hypothetical protein